THSVCREISSDSISPQELRGPVFEIYSQPSASTAREKPKASSQLLPEVISLFDSTMSCLSSLGETNILQPDQICPEKITKKINQNLSGN
ncbi:TPA: hypothetical protein ACNIE9_004570, partial [Enterobacter chengduensis]